jgi:hypothetical protein
VRHMVRTLALAGFVMFFGVTASQAQYTDSGPPPDAYASEYETENAYPDGYDYELLGDPAEYGHGYSEPDVNVGIFAGLGSDGRWFFAADFGWVWRPYAAAGWRPYSQGRWVWTSHGWTWVSYEPFGWATYHYGYWACDTSLGWVWIPGYEWSASRVKWAYYDNYVSWAPLPPPGYYCPDPWTSAGFSVWFTVGANRFCDPYPTRYCVTTGYPTVYRERVAYKSPGRHHIERYTGSSIRTSTVKFKNTNWSRTDGSVGSHSGRTKFSSNKESVSMKSVSRKSDARTLTTTQRSGRTERSALKTQTSKPDTRRFSEASRRVTSSTWQRQSAGKKQDTRSTRDIVESRKGVSGKEWTTARAERRSQVQLERKAAPRQERVVRNSSRSTMQSKQSIEPRKNVASVKKSSRVEKSSGRESNVKRWESGNRGQGKKK